MSSNTAVAFVCFEQRCACHIVWWFCAISNFCQLNEKSILVCKQTLNTFLCCFCFVFNFLVFKNKDKKRIFKIHLYQYFKCRSNFFFLPLYHVIFKNMKQKLNLSVSSKGYMIFFSHSELEALRTYLPFYKIFTLVWIKIALYQ